MIVRQEHTAVAIVLNEYHIDTTNKFKYAHVEIEPILIESYPYVLEYSNVYASELSYFLRHTDRYKFSEQTQLSYNCTIDVVVHAISLVYSAYFATFLSMWSIGRALLQDIPYCKTCNINVYTDLNGVRTLQLAIIIDYNDSEKTSNILINALHTYGHRYRETIVSALTSAITREIAPFPIMLSSKRKILIQQQ